jgi:glycosyltransferase involved in cell wall biosynthesis
MACLRLLHVTPYYASAWAYGGIPRAAAALCCALASLGHDVTVATTDVCDAHTRTAAEPALDVRSGVCVRTFPNRSNRLAYHLQVFTPIGLRAWLAREVPRFDAVHVHAHRHALEAQAAAACARAGVPFILTPNGTAPRLERRLFAKWMFDKVLGERVLRRAAFITAVSHAERRQLHALGVPDTLIRLLPNSVDLSEFEARPASTPGERRPPRVLFLGKLTPRKGVDVLLQAFAQLRLDARLAIAGNDMGEERKLRGLVRRLDLGARVDWLGLLRAQARLAALADADVVAYPSRDEVFGIVALEALLCGTPVIVSDDNGCGEIVGRLGGGMAVPYGDANALARGIEAILQAPAEWRHQAARAAERVRREYASNRVAVAAEDLYQEARLVRPGAAA